MPTVLGIVMGCLGSERSRPHITEQTKKNWKASNPVTAMGSHCGLGVTLLNNYFIWLLLMCPVVDHILKKAAREILAKQVTPLLK